MAQDEKRALWYIKKIPLFQDVSHDTIHKLVQCVELKEVRRRQVVYLPGDPGQTVYFVNSMSDLFHPDVPGFSAHAAIQQPII